MGFREGEWMGGGVYPSIFAWQGLVDVDMKILTSHFYKFKIGFLEDS